jgi:hypothetical protein
METRPRPTHIYKQMWELQGGIQLVNEKIIITSQRMLLCTYDICWLNNGQR